MKENDKVDGNVLEFSSNLKDKTILTENDINNLFLGFIRLIKRSVVIEKEKIYKTEIQSYQKKVNEYMILLQTKQDEIDKLKLEMKKV